MFNFEANRGICWMCLASYYTDERHSACMMIPTLIYLAIGIANS